MFTIQTDEAYEAALKRAEELRTQSILDGAEAAELVALLAAVEEWEETSALRKAPPGSFVARRRRRGCRGPSYSAPLRLHHHHCSWSVTDEDGLGGSL